MLPTLCNTIPHSLSNTHTLSTYIMQHTGICYELFGFDVLLDTNFKPWLIEVNVSPSLMGSSPLDRTIKGTLMADVFHLVGFQPYDDQAVRREEKRKASNKLRGVADGRHKAALSRRQDTWRRTMSCASIELSELSTEDWEVRSIEISIYKYVCVCVPSPSCYLQLS